MAAPGRSLGSLAAIDRKLSALKIDSAAGRAFKYEAAQPPDTMAQQSGHIVEQVHDEPHLAGRRLTVRFLQQQVEGRGLSPAAVADRYDLDVADVYRALAYYHENPEEMRAAERRREQVVADNREDAVTGPEDLE